MYFQPVDKDITGFLFARRIWVDTPNDDSIKHHAEAVSLNDIHQHDLNTCYIWIHLDRNDTHVINWLKEEPLIDNTVLASLCVNDSRPRTIKHEGGVLINLRAINFNPNKEPEEMVSICLWITEKLIISVQNEHVISATQLKENIDAGLLPNTQADFVADLTKLLLENINTTVDALERRIDIAEEEVFRNNKNKSSVDLADIRREAFMLRRYLLPQKEALYDFSHISVPWMTNTNLLLLKELADKTTFLAEELSEVRDRATLVHGQFAEKRDIQMNNTMLLLAVVSVIFMPMGLITGLMGMNVGGVPWVGSTTGFIFSCILTCSAGITTAIVLKIGASLFNK